jgi:hypothetical protein
MQFTTTNSPQSDIDISYTNKLISTAYDTTFLGIYVDSMFYWKIHIEQITHKLRAAISVTIQN